MTDVKQLQQERNQIFKDLYNNVIPKRTPVQMTISPLIVAEYYKKDIIDVQYDYSRIADVAADAAQLVYSDSCPLNPASLASRIAGGYQLLESQSFVMGQNGYMQHPEVIGMHEDEYDELIKDPYACLVEKVIPRQHKALSLDDPVKRANSIAYVKAENARQLNGTLPIIAKLTEQFGYYNGAKPGSGGFTAAPFDFLADQLRSFSGISKDIRRHRTQILEACDALLPLMFHLGLPANPDNEGAVGMPLHMPTFMREKDFVEVWMPTYIKLITQYAARGIRTRPFLEDNWMRYVDILQDFPAGTILKFEYGDEKLIKDKLGKKFIVTGVYPLNLVKQGTKQQVLDEAKRHLDIMLPGGGFFFSLDKGPLMASDINFENYKALSEFIRDYSVYDNAGESFGSKINEENYTIDPTIGDFTSKYITSWEETKEKYPLTPDYMKDVINKYEITELKFFLNLLV